jgi:hypothetical protein
MNMPRMRTAKEIAREFKELDPQTCISESSIRRLAKEGTLCSVKIGTKHLINLDYCIDYFNQPLSGLKLCDEPDNLVTFPTDTNRMELFKQRIGITA